jgi:glycosyltransferase involved in cell wall biosynthesis
MKIMLHSNAPWANTGYGTQCAMLARRLRDAGHDVAISAFYGLQGSGLEWEGMHVYPSDHTGFGKAMLPYYVGNHANSEVAIQDVLVLTLMDVWALGPDAVKGLNVASWTPVDHDPLPPTGPGVLHPLVGETDGDVDVRTARLADFGADYVPHAIDTNVFRPFDNRDEIREGMGVDKDAFVIGMVANNKGQAPPRKAFPQVMQAFSVFREKHPDAILYLHSEVFGVDMGVNLLALANICGIPDEALATSDQVKLHLGIPAEKMALLYNGFDVLASPSYGEGFGVPILEAQACGVPVIVTDWTAMTELMGAGWLVDGDPFYDPPHGAFYKCPSVAEVLDSFEAAYAARGDEQLKQQAREFSLGYDVDKVFAEQWLPVIEKVGKPREIAPLGNRAQRRAKKKVAA